MSSAQDVAPPSAIHSEWRRGDGCEANNAQILLQRFYDHEAANHPG